MGWPGGPDRKQLRTAPGRWRSGKARRRRHESRLPRPGLHPGSGKRRRLGGRLLAAEADPGRHLRGRGSRARNRPHRGQRQPRRRASGHQLQTGMGHQLRLRGRDRSRRPSAIRASADPVQRADALHERHAGDGRDEQPADGAGHPLPDRRHQRQWPLLRDDPGDSAARRPQHDHRSRDWRDPEHGGSQRLDGSGRDGHDLLLRIRARRGLQRQNPVAERGLGDGCGGGSRASKIEKLQPGVIYHYRAVAVNALGATHGQDRTFVAGATPRISSVRSRNLSESAVDLYADINPLGIEHEIPLRVRAAGDLRKLDVRRGNSARRPRTSRSPRISKASNRVSSTTSGSSRQTRSARPRARTRPSTSLRRNCPNSHVRQQTGSNYLPDCRAYELVTPESAGGMYIVPSDTLFDWGRRYGFGESLPFKVTPQNTGLANSPSRFNYFGALGGLNGLNTPNITSDMYVSTRTSLGWESTYPGPLGERSLRRREGPVLDRARQVPDPDGDQRRRRRRR